MVKILYVTTVGNTLNFYDDYLMKLRNRGYDVQVASNFNNLNSKFKLDKKGFKLNQISFSRSPFSISNFTAYKQMKKLISEEKYDIVHVHTPVASFITRLALKKKNIKVVYTAHGYHFYKGAPLKNWLLFYPLEKYMSKYTDIIININKEDYKLSKEKFKMKKAVFIPGVGIDTNIFSSTTDSEKAELRNEFSIDPNDRVIIMVGELNDNKNQITIIKAIKFLLEKNQNYRLILVGEGPNRTLYEKIINQENLCDKVTLLGFRSDVDKLMKASDILVSASKREGLPVNVMEGMSVGLPVVVSSIRGNVDLVENEINGYLVEKNEPSLFANKVHSICEQPVLYSKMQKNNLEKSKNLDSKKIAIKNDEVYTLFSNKKGADR